MTKDGCACNLPDTSRPRQAIFDTALYAAVVAGIAWLLFLGAEKQGYNWQWHQIPKYLIGTFRGGEWTPGLLLDGLLVTFKISAISLGLAFAIGLSTALARMSKSPVARGLARVYMEAVRNSPLLIQLFFIYFVLAPILDMSAFTAAVLSLSLFEGAYASEIFRAGITSIEAGQFEAAKSLGMNAYQQYRHIILPQAIRRILPPLTSQAVSLVKDSALVSTIAIADLTMQGQTVIAETFLTFEIWFTVAAIYLAVTLLLSSAASMLEHRYNTAMHQ